MTFKRGARALVGLTLAGGLLAACSAHPGAAAVVDGEEISENFLADAVRDFEVVTGQPTSAAAMISTLAITPTMLDAAAEFGIGASEEEATALLDAQIETVGGTPPADGYAQGVIEIAQMTLVDQQIQFSEDGMAIGERIAERIAETDIELNPRYGEITADGNVVPPDYPWLATPTPTPGELPQG
ncbi:hypothetical protein [Georgenia faecalis]|uniref:Lipoprotein n=1 Tax=Georgenia faecalis TaxID=2483799 RepID=A0ABV9D6U9_9MICO|nr:hypothetical protein [Georgenia faecalis]